MKNLDQIKALPLNKRTIDEEYQLARHEQRQPLCIFCGKPLRIEQALDVYATWDWDEDTKKYVRDEEIGNAYKPCCSECEHEDWDFTEALPFSVG